VNRVLTLYRGFHFEENLNRSKEGTEARVLTNRKDGQVKKLWSVETAREMQGELWGGGHEDLVRQAKVAPLHSIRKRQLGEIMKPFRGEGGEHKKSGIQLIDPLRQKLSKATQVYLGVDRASPGLSYKQCA